MKAVIYKKYGTPEVLNIVDLPVPIPKPDEVLVRIYTTSINSADWEMLTGSSMGRVYGLFKPGYLILGSDLSGVIESVGDQVKDLKLGDRVYADLSEEGFSTFAEYVCVKASALSLIPDIMSFDDAAAIPSAGVIALQSIENTRYAGANDQVLLNGAGGSMGMLALQILKSRDANVTAVDKQIKASKILELGADRFIDYTSSDYRKEKIKYDRVVDCFGIYKSRSYFKLLKPKGIYYAIGGKVSSMLNVFIFGSIASLFSSKKVSILYGRTNRRKDMVTLKELYKNKAFVPVIDRTYPLTEIKAAFEYYKSGDFIGKILIKVYNPE